jgi:hypothetical protein
VADAITTRVADAITTRVADAIITQVAVAIITQVAVAITEGIITTTDITTTDITTTDITPVGVPFSLDFRCRYRDFNSRHPGKEHPKSRKARFGGIAKRGGWSRKFLAAQYRLLPLKGVSRQERGKER